MSIDITRLGPAAQKQIAQKLQAQGAARNTRQSKYRAKPDTRGGIRFDSRREARRYDELMVMLKSGAIQDLKLQPQFTLQEAYTTPDGARIVEDVKSTATKTREYELKKKLLLERFGVEIVEVME